MTSNNLIFASGDCGALKFVEGDRRYLVDMSPQEEALSARLAEAHQPVDRPRRKFEPCERPTCWLELSGELPLLVGDSAIITTFLGDDGHTYQLVKKLSNEEKWFRKII